MDPLDQNNQIHISAPPDDGESPPPDRLDRWLAQAISEIEDMPALSRNRIKALILDGSVSEGGTTITNPSATVKPGHNYAIIIPEAEPAEPIAQDIALDVVYEDEDVIVVNKPAGMTVHPAPGSPDGTLVNALLAHCGDSLSGIGGVKRPGIVHRIDKDTSGLIISAKNDAAHHHLSDQFASHELDRKYHAVVWGRPQPTTGAIEGNIGRSPKNRKKMAVVSSGGKHAVTHYRTKELFSEAAALIECELETGRTHQIRVHFANIGHPLIGDPVYGGGTTRARRFAAKTLGPDALDYVNGFPRQALHAKSLGFEHPRTGEKLYFESPLPDDILELITRLSRRIEE